MNRLLVKDLHLAAYMKSNDAKFLGHESKHFVFEDTKTLGEWSTAIAAAAEWIWN